MRMVTITCLTLFSCLINAEFPVANGAYVGAGYASSNHVLDNIEYQSQITVNDAEISAVFTDDNGRVANLIYTLTPISEDFFDIDVTLKYQTGTDSNREWHGKGRGNCHVGICHLNSEIHDLSDDIKSVRISDLFALESGADIRRKVAIDIYATEPSPFMSYALAEMVTLSSETME